MRIVKILVDAGYLTIKHEVERSFGANTYFVRIPEGLMQSISKSKDRFTIGNPSQGDFISDPSDKNVTTPGDKDVTHNINKYINNKTNNNSTELENKVNFDSEENVVVFSEMEPLIASTQAESLEIEAISLNIRRLEEQRVLEDQKLTELFKQKSELLKTSFDNESFVKANMLCNEQAAFLSQIETQLLSLETNKKRLHKAASLQNESKHSVLLNRLKGQERPLSANQREHLTTGLMRLCSKDQLDKLKREIEIEVRLGSLTKTRDNKADLPLDTALNIALKLVREKRWQTPRLLASA